MGKSGERAAIASDLHLEEHIWASKKEIYGDAYFAFDQIVTKTLEHGCKRLILIGDILDSTRPSSATTRVLREQCDRLHAAGCEIEYLLGQHDLAEPSWFEAASRWPLHIRGVFRFLGRRAFGFDFIRDPEAFRRQLDAIPQDIEILFTHQVWADFLGIAAVCQGEFADIPANVQMLFTGDYHKHFNRKLSRNRGNNQLAVYSPGSSCIQAIDESADKKFFIVDSDLTVTSVPLKHRPVIHFRPIEDELALQNFLGDVRQILDETAEASADLPAELRKPIFEIPVFNDVEAAIFRIRAAVGDRAHVFETPVVVTAAIDPQLARACKAVLDQGLTGAVSVCTADDRELKEACLALLSSELRPAEALVEMRKAFFARHQT